MRKNKKGFTLVELLAVIIILGILVVFSIPLMMRYINYSKSKTYIQDANKLISVAEYKISSNSLKIEKPDPGNCIVLSYDYLNDGSIDNPPGKGSYLGSASYVVVKNSSSGKLEYSAALIEEAKDGGYSGLMLSSPSQMNNTFGFSRVDSYDRNDLTYINDELCRDSCVNTDSKRKLEEKEKEAKRHRESTDDISLSAEEVDEIKENCKNECASAKMVSRQTINTDLGSDYVSSIEKIYTEDELEQGDPVGAFSPKIVSAHVENGDINVYNSTIKMRVVLVASDKDSNQLNVCIKSSETDDFSGAAESCEDYISGNLYVKEYSFPLDSEHPDKIMHFLIKVTDENGNSTSTTVSSSFSKNSPPVVSASVSKRKNDRCNTYIAAVNINASDDRDLVSGLKFCINKSEKCDESDFMAHSSFFNLNNCDENGNNCTYDFDVDNGNSLDGKNYDIYVHVMDSSNQITTTKLNYKVYEIKNPTVNFSLNPYTIQDRNTLVNYNRLSGEYNLSIDGTCSFDNKINLIFSSSDGIGKTMTYADYLANYSNRKYEFLGDYDGRNRTVKLNVTAEYGVNIDKTATLNNVYTDQPPVVKNFSVTSHSGLNDCAKYCDASDSSCSSSCEGGNVADVNFDVTDDLDTDLQYCVSEDAAECDVDSNFKNLSEFDYRYNFNVSGDHPYTESLSNRTLYLTVKDKKHKVYKSANYKLYVNQPAVILGSVDVFSLDETKNLNEVTIDTSNMDIIDDFDDYSTSVCYKYKDNDYCSDSVSDTLKLIDSNGNGINDSSTIEIYIKVTDSYGMVTESEKTTYNVTPNPAPRIVDVYAKSTEEEYNSNIFDIYYKVYDPEDTYSVCLSEDSNYTGCAYGSGEVYSGFDNENPINRTEIDAGDDSQEDINMIKHESGWDYNYTTPKSLYLYVIDSSNNLVKRKVDYTLYKMCDDTFSMDAESYELDTSISNNNELTYYRCGGNCYKDPSNTFESVYNVSLKYEDKNLGSSCGSTTESATIRCDHPLCVKSALETGHDTYDYVIGNTFISHAFQEEDLSGNSVACTGYYRLYTVRVDNYNVSPTHLNDVYTIACAELVGTKYKIRDKEHGSADEKYIRIDDKEYVEAGLKSCSDPNLTSYEPCLEGGD